LALYFVHHVLTTPALPSLHSHVIINLISMLLLLFFFTATPPPAIYTLSLHDALPILTISPSTRPTWTPPMGPFQGISDTAVTSEDRKSTRLNSSHVSISYAVFCLKKKKKNRSTAAQKHRSNPGSRGMHTTDDGLTRDT